MSDFILTLGGVAFRDFEIPESIRAGGSQALEVHRYAGGKRTVDASGPDDDPIAWSGVFLDSDAQARAQQIDAMRRQGRPVALAWAGYSYLVIVKTFIFDFERFYQVRYAITLEVVDDHTQPAAIQGDDLESSMQGDIVDALTFAGEIGDVSLTASVNGFSGTAIPLGSITGASVSDLIAIGSDVADAQARTGELFAAADTNVDLLGKPSLFAAGIPPVQMVNNTNALAEATAELPILAAMTNTLARLDNSLLSVTS